MGRVLLAFLLLAPLPSVADEIVRTITVYGKAEHEVKPDVAMVGVTIENKSMTLEETKRKQDAETKKLLQIAKELRVNQDDLRTQHAQINPHYEYNRETKKQVFKGYRANTTVQIKLRDLEKVGVLLDKLVRAGFDRVNNVRYILDDDIEHRDAVLVEALSNAKNKAEKMAKRLGGNLGQAITVNEGYKSAPVLYQPKMMRSMAMDAAPEAMSASASVAPPSGLIELNGTVTAIFELKE